MIFLRESTNPQADIIRNFSGYAGRWFSSFEDAQADAFIHQSAIHPPRQDPNTGLWSSDPEWGLSGYALLPGLTVATLIERLVMHHGAHPNQIHAFSSNEYNLGSGADGEDCFKNAIYLGPASAAISNTGITRSGTRKIRPEISKKSG